MSEELIAGLCTKVLSLHEKVALAKILAIRRPPRYSRALWASSPLVRCSQSTLLLSRHGRDAKVRGLAFSLKQREQVQGDLD